jgi:hypothetical protein
LSLTFCCYFINCPPSQLALINTRLFSLLQPVPSPRKNPRTCRLLLNQRRRPRRSKLRSCKFYRKVSYFVSFPYGLQFQACSSSTRYYCNHFILSHLMSPGAYLDPIAPSEHKLSAPNNDSPCSPESVAASQATSSSSGPFTPALSQSSSHSSVLPTPPRSTSTPLKRTGVLSNLANGFVRGIPCTHMYQVCLTGSCKHECCKERALQRQTESAPEDSESLVSPIRASKFPVNMTPSKLQSEGNQSTC